MSQYRKRSPFYLAAFILGFLFYATIQPFVSDYLSGTPDPYSNVQIIDDHWYGDRLEILATFTKNDGCILKSFITVGYSSDIPNYVEFTDNDSIPPLFDREPGDQALNITVDLSDKFYDVVEVRTRHECVVLTHSEGIDGETVLTTDRIMVNKIFYTFERPA